MAYRVPARNNSYKSGLNPGCVDLSMGKTWTPSIVPNDQTVYLVLDDLGRLGPVWREADAIANFTARERPQ